MPARPAAGLPPPARRKGIDRARREGLRREKQHAAARLETREREGGPGGQGRADGEIGEEGAVTVADMSAVPDDPLRLMFTCFHPALAPETRGGLMVRTAGGLTTPQTAKAF